MNLTNIVTIVGGTGNVGRGVAEALRQPEFRVCILSRGRAPKERPTVPSRETRFYKCDVRDDAEFRSTLRRIVQEHGGISTLIYTPALPPDPDIALAEYPLAMWKQTMEVYVQGFLTSFQECLRLMKSGGHIFAISSAVTRFPEAALPPLHIGHYAAAKAALNELCKWGRREAHEKGILLSRIAPGALDVPYHRTAPAYRKPKATLPVGLVVGKIVGAISSNSEIDEEIVASTPDSSS